MLLRCLLNFQFIIPESLHCVADVLIKGKCTQKLPIIAVEDDHLQIIDIDYRPDDVQAMIQYYNNN